MCMFVSVEDLRLVAKMICMILLKAKFGGRKCIWMLLLSLTFREVFVMLLGKIRLCYLVSWWSVYVCCLWSLSCLSGLEPDFRRQLEPPLVERAIKTFSRLRDTRTTVYTKSYTGKSGLLSPTYRDCFAFKNSFETFAEYLMTPPSEQVLNIERYTVALR